MSGDADHKVDREGWPPGPWNDEPDKVQFRTRSGLPGLAVRNHGGAWCGYVGVPPGHPHHGKSYGDIGVGIGVHGGLTYSDACRGPVCHVPEPGEPDNVTWFGFDCLHHGDWAPGHSYATWQRSGHPEWAKLPDGDIWGSGGYRDLDYVRREVESLAEQLAAAVP